MYKNIKSRIKINQRISDHLIEAVLIFASVYFAFWLNDYRNEENEKQYSLQAQEAVLNELRKTERRSG